LDHEVVTFTRPKGKKKKLKAFYRLLIKWAGYTEDNNVGTRRFLNVPLGQAGQLSIKSGTVPTSPLRALPCMHAQAHIHKNTCKRLRAQYACWRQAQKESPTSAPMSAGHS